ncbi:hypothetical protein [Planktothrix paucivesiculata]|uniref:Uncharacterized protein n=1 Tax=Planktothrix paucivesiculata PCC 9631 TaxID=671071 RepID=A0A7Z9DWB2_9CYAN|nr:hypothetical protein [Planktothrix paucivesiculata]VXD12165.1 exported hypothetical protein [Planktothrix paucivesiculata PCC 9631]
MNTNKTNGLSTRTKIWMGVGAYILTAGLGNVANASTTQSLSNSIPEIASGIATSGDTFTSRDMLQASTDGDTDSTKDDDKKDEGGESGEGGEG